MSRTKALVGIALIFLLGIIFGLALSIRLSMLRVRSLAKGTPAELAEVTVSRLNRNVKFTTTQRNQAREIIFRAEEEIQSIQQRIAPEIDAINQRTQDQLRALLSPAQAQQLAPPTTPDR